MATEISDEYFAGIVKTILVVCVDIGFERWFGR